VFFQNLWVAGLLASVDLTEESIPSVKMAIEVIHIRPDDQQDTTYCYCHGPKSGSMLACDNNECPIEWYYLKFLNRRIDDFKGEVVLLLTAERKKVF